MGNKYKRPARGADKGAPPAKKARTAAPPRKITVKGPADPVLAAYAEWCQKSGIVVSPKVAFTAACAAGRGMVAVTAVAPGEVLFEIPRAVVLSPVSPHCRARVELAAFAFATPRAPHDSSDADDAASDAGSDADAGRGSDSDDGDDDAMMDGRDNQGPGWAPLLLALVHERALKTSFWRPYLGVCGAFIGLVSPTIFLLTIIGRGAARVCGADAAAVLAGRGARGAAAGAPAGAPCGGRPHAHARRVRPGCWAARERVTDHRGRRGWQVYRLRPAVCGCAPGAVPGRRGLL